MVSWVEYSNRSMNGEVCGIIGCDEQPKNKCPICNHFYCQEHIRIHFHIGKGGYEELEQSQR